MDGTQARLKHTSYSEPRWMYSCGKGGWDSGEIETFSCRSDSSAIWLVERVDGTQARLKPMVAFLYLKVATMWKGWMGLRRD